MHHYDQAILRFNELGRALGQKYKAEAFLDLETRLVNFVVMDTEAQPNPKFVSLAYTDLDVEMAEYDIVLDSLRLLINQLKSEENKPND